MKKENEDKKKIDRKDTDTASFYPGSTVQGGSNFGQGQTNLGKDTKQGSQGNKGANYENEQGWNNEALRGEDI